MDALKVFKTRRSIRTYRAKPISDDHLNKIVDAARLAPTARNIQPWEFITVKDPQTLESLGQVTSPNGALISKSAACLVILCSDTKYYLEDGCAATTQAILSAAAQGIGSCWIAGDKKDYCEVVKNLLGVPAGYKLVSLVALGFSQESPQPAKRPLKEVLHKEKF